MAASAIMKIISGNGSAGNGISMAAISASSAASWHRA
jgi:hypothetical protein